MAEKRLADRLIAEVASDPNHFGGEIIDTAHGNEEHTAVTDVDRRARSRNRVLEDGGVELGSDLVRVRIADEAKGHVPILGRDESGADLILAMERLERLGHAIG